MQTRNVASTCTWIFSQQKQAEFWLLFHATGISWWHETRTRNPSVFASYWKMLILTNVHHYLTFVHHKFQVDCFVKNGNPFNLTSSKLISFPKKVLVSDYKCTATSKQNKLNRCELNGCQAFFTTSK